jgi:hypothetical protein
VSASARRVVASAALRAGLLAVAIATAGVPGPADAAAARPARRAVRTPAAANGLEGLPIRNIRIVARDVYDPVPPTRLAPLHRLANRLHVRTRESTVRGQLLFEPGDPWRARLGQETARHLRSLDFLVPVRIQPVRVGDSVDVVVETRDLWTTAPEINLERGGGSSFGSVGFTERNLIGLGKSVAIEYNADPAGDSRSFAFEDGAIAGTRHRFHWKASSGAGGAMDAVTASLPFGTESSPYAWTASWRRATSVVRLYEQGVEVASLDRRDEDALLEYGIRMPIETAAVVRLTGRFVALDRRLGPSRLMPGAPTAFEGGEESQRERRATLELRVWRPRFVEAENVDRMDRVEDFDLGASAWLEAGGSFRALGAGADEGWVRLQLRRGTQVPFGIGWLDAEASARLADEPRELIGRLEARGYVLTLPRHTLAFSLRGASGTNVSREYQLVTGGLSGLRAYPVHALAGRRLWQFNAEERWFLTPDDWPVVRVAAAAFYDAGRAWGAGAGRGGWLADAGVGVRLGFPQLGLSQVLRLDVAWPVGRFDGDRAAVWSFGSAQAF